MSFGNVYLGKFKLGNVKLGKFYWEMCILESFNQKCTFGKVLLGNVYLGKFLLGNVLFVCRRGIFRKMFNWESVCWEIYNWESTSGKYIL